MQKKHLTLLVLFISTIGFSTGVYYKYIKSYSDEKLQMETTNLRGDEVLSPLKLGDVIGMMEEHKILLSEHKIESNEIVAVLKQSKTINSISIVAIMICCFSFVWSIYSLARHRDALQTTE